MLAIDSFVGKKLQFSKIDKKTSIFFTLKQQKSCLVVSSFASKSQASFAASSLLREPGLFCISVPQFLVILLSDFYISKLPISYQNELYQFHLLNCTVLTNYAVSLDCSE